MVRLGGIVVLVAMCSLWSPTGTSIRVKVGLLRRIAPGVHEAVVSGGPNRVLPSAPSSLRAEAAWSPSGRWLAVMRGTEVIVLDASSLRTVWTNVGEPAAVCSWLPGSDTLMLLGAAPDKAASEAALLVEMPLLGQGLRRSQTDSSPEPSPQGDIAVVNFLVGGYNGYGGPVSRHLLALKTQGLTN